MRVRIFLVVGISLLLAWGIIALNIVAMITHNTEFDANADAVRSLAFERVPLLMAIKDIKSDVIQVQQWLTDISATRASPGFDDGFDEAARYAQLFSEHVNIARAHAETLELPDVAAALDTIEAKFPPFYDGGREMADAYIAKGPSSGNLLMARFDSVAAQMDEAMTHLVATVEFNQIESLEALADRSNVMADESGRITYQSLIAAIVILVVSVSGLFVLFRALTRSFSALDRDIANVMSGNETADLELSGARNDEFGPIARALHRLRENLAEAQAKDAKLRKAALAEARLRQDAEETRRKQAEEKARAATEIAERQAARAERETQVLAEIADVVSSCASGNFAARLELGDKDGVYADLCACINEIGETANAGLGAIRNALYHLAQGDLDHRMSGDFSGVFADIADTVNATSASLGQILGGIRESATTVDSSTREIATATNDLAHRSEHAANALAETATAVDEIKGRVATATNSAHVAEEAVLHITRAAEVGQEVLGRATAVMEEIQESSIAIERILQVIDDITFQTNLLALNAGVESARAGEAGRGFAVVASEVRALAQRSGDAAREIAELIKTSGACVKQGVSRVRDTAAALEDIANGVTNVTDRIGDIVATMNETNQGIAEVARATSLLDATTQQNAAMFEQTNAAQRILQTEAEALAHATASFTLTSVSAPTLPAPQKASPTDAIAAE